MHQPDGKLIRLIKAEYARSHSLKPIFKNGLSDFRTALMLGSSTLIKILDIQMFFEHRVLIKLMISELDLARNHTLVGVKGIGIPR